jgi:flagellar biosynthetic protein FlhB
MSAPDQDQRKLPASEKRKKEFKDRGEVARSRELASLVGSLGAVLGLSIAAPIDSFSTLMKKTFRSIEEPNNALYQEMFWTFISAFTPVAILGMLLTVLAIFVQLGWPPTFGKIGFDFTKLFSMQGLVSLFSLKESAKRTLSATISTVLVGVAAYLALRGDLYLLFTSRAHDPRSLLGVLSGALLNLTIYAGGALLLFSAVLYWRQYRELNERMMMTPEEAKREHKEQEGDPMIKRQRMKRRRELSRGRMSAVKTADVVVVNPTHFAVALRYRSGKDKAPKVIAKGVDAKAARIREIARAAGVPIVPQPPLARILYKVAPEGKEIPGNLYHAVAEVLAYVYKLKARTRTQRKPKPIPRKQVGG